MNLSIRCAVALLYRLVCPTILLLMSMVNLQSQVPSCIIDSLKLDLSKASQAEDSVFFLIRLADGQLFNNKTQSAEHLEVAQALTKRQQHDSLLAEVYFAWEHFYAYQDNTESALDYLDSARYIFTSLECIHCLARINEEKGHILTFSGDYNEAYKALLKAYGQYQDLGDIHAANYTRILLATALDHLKTYDQAEVYYKAALDHLIPIKDTIADYQQISLLSVNYATHLTSREKYEQAQVYFRLAEHLAEIIQDDYGIFSARLGLGWTYAELGVLDSALMYCTESLALSKRFDDIYGEGYSCKCLGKVELGQKNYDLAEAYLLRADSLMTNTGILLIQVDVKELLVKLYKEQGKYEAAFRQQEAYQMLNDSTYNIDKAGQLALLQTQHNIEEQRRKNESLQKDLRHQTRLKQIYILLGILGGLVLLLVLRLLWAQKNNSATLEKLVEKRTAKLEEANNELKEFAYITSHDMREPIRSINSFSTLIQRRIQEQKYEEVPEFLQIIQNNSIQLNTLIKDVYSFMRIEDEKMSLETFLGSELVTDTQRDLYLMIEEKNARVEIVGDAEIVSNRSLLRIILRNLVENSLKYNESSIPLVNINVKKSDAYYVVIVSDNGIGVAPTYYDQVFRMFKRLHDRETYAGSGLGLAICRKIAHKLGGDIKITGEGLENRGISIELKVPRPVTS